MSEKIKKAMAMSLISEADTPEFITFRDLSDLETVVIYTGSGASRNGEEREILQRSVNAAIIANNPIDPEIQPVFSLYVSPQQLDSGGQLYRMADCDATSRVIVHLYGQLHFNKQLRLIAELQRQAPMAEIYIGHPDRNAEPWTLVDFYQQLKVEDERKTRLPLSVGFSGYDSQQGYLVKGLLPAASMCSFYGPSGAGKSFAAVSLACHVATGTPWDERKVDQGAVLYIVGEGGVGVPRRIRAWADEYFNSQDVVNLYCINTPVFMADDAQVSELLLASTEVVRRTGLPVKLIVVDTVARCFGGGDENRAADMGAFIAGCDRAKAATGATVLLIHHTGKNEDNGARGSSALRAALDAEFLLKRERQDGRAVSLICTKMKDGEEPDRQAHDLKPRLICYDVDGDEVTSLVLIDSGRESCDWSELDRVGHLTTNHRGMYHAIRALCQSQGGIANWGEVTKFMSEAGSLDKKNCVRHRTKLLDEGLIVMKGEKIWLAQSVD